ncbi:MAG: YigZ family protein [Ignavibacteriaceae bacterium]
MKNFNPEILTIDKTFEYKLKEQGSEFTAIANPVNSEQETDEILGRVKTKYHDASHHCYAYRLDKNTYRYSDAGEPSGTAGIRILNAIDHFSLSRILIIVVRYFGGKKLGTGLLGKTYYKAAFNVLNQSSFVKRIAFRSVTLTVDFTYLNNFYHLIKETESRIVKSEFEEKAKFNCMIKPELIEEFISKMKEISGGRIKTEVGREIIYL